jgi:RNA polymerase sigma-70 factor (sigma-E family)
VAAAQGVSQDRCSSGTRSLFHRRRKSCNKASSCGIYLCVGDSPRANTADAGTRQQAGTGSESFEDLYEALYEPMARLAYLLTGSGSTAEDLAQDCFARLHQHWPRVRQPAAYLRTSVVNACRAFHRRERRERAHFAELVTTEVPPDTLVVLDALSRLPYRQRAALVLRFYEDRPDSEIAEFLGCRPATVRSLVHRGLSALRKVIDQ